MRRYNQGMVTAGLFLILGFGQTSYPAYSVKPLTGVTIPGLPEITSHICVDQFGYLPDEAKVAIVSDPVKGYNSFDHYKPGDVLLLKDRKGRSVFANKVTLWKDGAVNEDSGDRGWWFDFTSVKKPGEYYIYDPASKKRSAVFHIGPDCYRGVLRAASRMYYYQRIGMPIESKYAEGPWKDEAIFLQDSRARSVEDKNNAALERDLSGGWMDAGDTDKYPPFNGDVIHPLLYAYEANPKAFGDNFNIPESGNGRPDILDEVKYQLDWLVRMQFTDGSVPVKMGNIDYNGKYPLGMDLRTRYYGPKDSGATIFTCANFAHAARVYSQFAAWKPFANELQGRALKAWSWYHSHPRTFKTDTGEIKSGIANRSAEDQDRMEAFAAIHLFGLTGDETYQKVIREKAGAAHQLSEGLWSPYEAGASESLVDYLAMPKADSKVCARIRAQLTKSAMSDQFAPAASVDLYRSWMQPTNYHWGSNTVRANWGVVALLASKYADVDPATRDRLRQRAADMLHSFHGVNPLSVVYLTNMKSVGAEHSLVHIYHARYGQGTPFSNNAPPGYVVGGPNQSYGGKAAAGGPSLDWIKTQPRGKAYADFDLAWPESSWELSEPAIYYQAMYVRLLAAFAK